MFSPFDWFGPIAGREMLIVARRRRYTVLRVGYGLFLLFLAYSAWRQYEGRINQQTMPRLAATVVASIGWWQIVICAVLAPVLLCDALSSERRGRNLDILLATSLDSKGLVHAKLWGRLLVIAQLLAISIPFVSLMSFFGGVQSGQFAILAIVAFLAAAATGSLALMFSVRTESALRALLGTVVRLTYVALGLVPIFGIAFGSWIGGGFGRRGPIGRGGSRWEATALVATIGIPCLIVGISLSVAAACRWLNALKTELELENDDRKKQRSPFFQKWNDKALERFLGSRNPLWNDRNLDYAPRGRTWVLRPLAMVVVSAALTALLFVLAPVPSESLGFMAAWLSFLATCLLLPFVIVLAATNPLLDRRQDIWSLLRMTDLTNFELLRGTFLALWPVLLWIGCGYLALGIVAIPASPWDVSMALGTMIAFCQLLVAVGTLTLFPERAVNPPQLPTVVFAGIVFLWPLPLAVYEADFGDIAFLGALSVAGLVGVATVRAKSRFSVAAHAASMHVFLVILAGLVVEACGVQISGWRMAPGYWIFRLPAELGTYYRKVNPFDWASIGYLGASVATTVYLWIYAYVRFNAFAERPHRVKENPIGENSVSGMIAMH